MTINLIDTDRQGYHFGTVPAADMFKRKMRFSELSRCGLHLDPCKLGIFTEITPTKSKKELKSFTEIMSYLNKYSLATSEICMTLRRQTLVKCQVDLEHDVTRNYTTKQNTIQERFMHEIL